MRNEPESISIRRPRADPGSVSLVAARSRSFVVIGLVAGLVLGAAACGSSSPSEIATPPATGFTPRTEPPGSTTEVPAPDTSAPETVPPDLGTPTLVDTSTISTVGLDKVQFGMTLDEAQAAAGTALTTTGPRDPSCFLASPAEGAAGITFLFSDGRVERVDIASAPIATRSGAKVGSTEAQVKELYGDQIEVQPRADGQPGNLLVFVPRDEADQEFRLVFTTDGTTVTSYRAGRVPQVLAPTGCA